MVLLTQLVVLILVMLLGADGGAPADDIEAAEHHDYVVIGAGPGGLQLGYYLQQADRDYVIYEMSNISGSFFNKYPRHDRLISINKRFTGESNKEFNMRHDWNSLLSHDERLLYKEYSHEFFPAREGMVEYLNDFRRLLDIRVRHNIHITNIHHLDLHHPAGGSNDRNYVMNDQHGRVYTCRTLVIATGLSKPYSPHFKGEEYVEGYESVSTDPKDFEGQSVLILGGGNAAFEVADSIYGSTNLVHVMRRSRARLSWSTHYVGDLRAVNNNLLDTYQLKSLDAAVEAHVEEMTVTRSDEDGRLRINFTPLGADFTTEMFDNFALREPYDRIIRCLGFTFDYSLFKNYSSTADSNKQWRKYPSISHSYESLTSRDLYYAGGLAHSLDYRQSSGGFIHGIRYTARALFRILDRKYELVTWPHTTFTLDSLVTNIIKRVNEASGLYQMFGFLGDVITIDGSKQVFKLHEDFPVDLLPDFMYYSNNNYSNNNYSNNNNSNNNNSSGNNTSAGSAEGSNNSEGGVGGVLVLLMQYGTDFSGPGKDTFMTNRAVGEPSEAHQSNFLHPVLYYYSKLPSAEDMANRGKGERLPRPDRIHHIVEDFLTHWDAPTSHLLPLRRFIEAVVGADLRNFYMTDCIMLYLTTADTPPLCDNYYRQGQGLSRPLMDMAAQSS